MLNRSEILKTIFTLSVALFVIHFFSTLANLYWTTSWADILAHTVGGAIVGSVFLYIASFNVLGFKTNLINIISFVFVVGIVWEIFELMVHFTDVNKPGYVSDSIGDLFFDVLGTYVSYLFLTNSKHE